MPADTFNQTIYGISARLNTYSTAAQVTAGQSALYWIPLADFTAMNAGDTIIITPPGATPEIFFIQQKYTDGGNYYVSLDGAPAGTSGYRSYFWADSYTLGTVKTISLSTESNMDVMGMPGIGDGGTLAFDVDGAVTTIDIDGSFFESTASTMSLNLTHIRGLIDGNQYINNPCVFWWDAELLNSRITSYFVAVKKFTIQRSEKDIQRVDYKLQLVRRALFI